jgi:hypothetical protein
MNCCQCQGIEDLFSEENVSRELSSYRKKGAGKTTRWLTEALKEEGVQGLSLLDIGGGVGAIQHELLDAGVQSAADIDASRAYIEAARSEAQRRGIAGRVSFQHGNFIDVAEQIPLADIVTLDRVICCYPDMEKLVDLSVSRARKLYGLVYPRDLWLVKIFIALQNFVLRLQRNPFRAFIHPTQAVEALVTRHGFRRSFYKRTLVWQVVVYSR